VIKFLNLYCLPLLISIALCFGVGLWDLLIDPAGILSVFLIVILTSILLIFIQQTTYKIFKICSFLICLLITLYIATGTGFLQGHMSIGIIASVFQTNHNEALEFFSVVQYKFVLYALILLLALSYFFLIKKQQTQIKFPKILIAVLLLLNVFNLFFIY